MNANAARGLFGCSLKPKAYFGRGEALLQFLGSRFFDLLQHFLVGLCQW